MQDKKKCVATILWRSRNASIEKKRMLTLIYFSPIIQQFSFLSLCTSQNLHQDECIA